MNIDVSASKFEDLLDREWLATNRLGGFACSTAVGLNTRKYHGLLVAAMLPPVRRMVMLSRIEETLVCDGWPFAMSSTEYPGTIFPDGHRLLRAFSNDPYPRWAYQTERWTLQKELRLIEDENTVVISYTLLGGDRPVQLEIRPLLALRVMHDLTFQWNGQLAARKVANGLYRIAPTMRTPELFFAHAGQVVDDAHWYLNTIYRKEMERGYSGLEDLWNPGIVKWAISPGQTVHFVCSTEPVELDKTVAKADGQFASTIEIPMERPGVTASLNALVRASEQFLAMTREKDTAMVTAFPWAAPSGRDALIAFPGLMLVTGRLEEAGTFLLAFAKLWKDGLMPSEFATDGSGPKYESADASLWFVHCVHQFARYGGDMSGPGRHLDEAVESILVAYEHGAGLGIVADSGGLIGSHQAGIPTSWMDARVGTWVVTPRSGQTVELNALWYNALRVGAEMARKNGHDARGVELDALADRVQVNFNLRFWNEHAGCCFDVIDPHGHDPSVRPNQLLAVSLPFPVLAMERHEKVVEKIRVELLTPMGVRTLSPADPAYQARYAGDVVSRDRAYHQGPAYPWLLGPLVTGYLRVHGKSERARSMALEMIEPCLKFIRSHGLGQLPELFDGESPQKPGGAIASARSVGEILRVYVEDVLDMTPAGSSSLIAGHRVSPATLKTGETIPHVR